MRTKSTKFIKLDTSKCIACWKCIDVCTSQILSKMVVLWHKHIVLKKTESCSGCNKCVKVCQCDAIRKIAKINT
ncbi:4Fe-4S binding protein [Dysgonomonas hofstadii]|uniref:4Fe-4S binding protein n=1 Tax=Dysgonomonas hofstadii TaxID=637886 RepID=UPI00162260C2